MVFDLLVLVQISLMHERGVDKVWVGGSSSEGRVGVIAPVVERWGAGDGEDGSLGLVAEAW